MINDCPVIGCEWRNSFKASSDGSREAALHYHFQTHEGTHPRGTCKACGTPVPGEPNKWGKIISGNPAELFPPFCEWHQSEITYDVPNEEPTECGCGETHPMHEVAWNKWAGGAYGWVYQTKVFTKEACLKKAMA